MSDVFLQQSPEAKEKLPSKEYFWGELRVEKNAWKIQVILRVDWEYQTFDIRDGVNITSTVLPFILQSQSITYSPELWMFHSTKKGLRAQATEFLALTYAEMLERIPRGARSSFNQEIYIAVQEFAQKITLRKSVWTLGKVLKYWLYSLFTTNIRGANYDIKSYIKDISIFAGFEAGIASPRFVSSVVGLSSGTKIWATTIMGMEKIASKLPGIGKAVGVTVIGIAGAMGAEKFLEKMKINKELWLAMNNETIRNAHQNLWEWANSIIGNTLSFNFSWLADATDVNIKLPLLWAIATSKVDATQSPVDYTSQSVGRNRDTWNAKLAIFEKETKIFISSTLGDFYKNTGDFKSVSWEDRYGILSKKLKEWFTDGINDKIHPIYEWEINNLVNSIVEYIKAAPTNGINPEWVMKNIEADYLQKMIITMQVPSRFDEIWPMKYVYPEEFWREEDDIPSQWQAVYGYREELINTIMYGNLKQIEWIYPTQTREFQFLRSCIARIMSWETPFLDNSSNKLKWESLLKNNNSMIIKWIQMSIGDYISHTLDLAAEFRQVNKWMYLVNKNGYGHEWRIAPQGSIAGMIEDKISK